MGAKLQRSPLSRILSFFLAGTRKNLPQGERFSVLPALLQTKTRLNHSTPSSRICQSVHTFVTHVIILSTQAPPVAFLF